jgi:hypothetical protein
MINRSLSTPWVAGSNPAGIASENQPIGVDFIRDFIVYRHCFRKPPLRRERKGIKRHATPP